MRIYQIYLWTSLWCSVCACVRAHAAHDSCSAAVTAVKRLLHKAVHRAASRAQRANTAYTPGLSAPSDLCTVLLLDCDLLAASHCSRHLFKAHAFKFCFSFPHAQMGRICMKVICLSSPKNRSGYITCQLCWVRVSSQIPNELVWPKLFERQHERQMKKWMNKLHILKIWK